MHSWYRDVTGSAYRLLAGFGLRLHGSGSGYVGLKPPSVGDNTDYVLPSTAPSSTGVLNSDSVGNLSWKPAFAWQSVSSSQVIVPFVGYIANNSSRVVLTLPGSSSVGDYVRVAGMGAGGWRVSQLDGQTIHFGDKATTTGTTGSISSQQTFDCLELVCITANTNWLVLSALGNLLIQ